MPVAGIANITEIKVHGNKNLRSFPPLDSFPYVHSLALSYAYHCCAYLNRMQTINPNVDNNSPYLHDSVLWLEDVDAFNVNLTISELSQQIWKQYQPTDYSDYEIEKLGIQYGYLTNEDVLASVHSTSAYPWLNTFDPHERKNNVFLQANVYENNGPKPIRCLPMPGPFMPCQDLFDWWTLRFGVWMVFPLALIGNGMVLVVLVFGRRRRRRRKLDVPRFLVCNLAAADFFMGIYLGMLALVDASTFGNFRFYAIRWQNSWACQMTGLVGVFSAELSVYTLAVITLERNYAITHAMHLNKRLSLRAASTIMSLGWCFAFIMALLPLFGISDYRKFAVCLPFETENSMWSLLYVLSLITFNGIAFILLMGCYLRMYCAIRGSQAWNSNDTRIAMRMGLLVFTDFLCWAPIAFFTVTAVTGWHLISLEEAKVFTVFVLPLNACANPFLYAFFTKQFKKECATLSRRIDAFTRMRHHCFGKRKEEDERENAPQPKVAANVDCRVCGHRNGNSVTSSKSHASSRLQLADHRPSLEPTKLKEKIKETLNDGSGSDAVSNVPHGPEPVNDNCIRRVSSPLPSSRDSKQRATVSECHCQHCACSKIKHSTTIEMIADDGRTWKAGQLVRNLFMVNGKNGRSQPSVVNVKKCHIKQFKSNSIIYQYNYRKNHIHMALETEMPDYKPNAKMARYKSEDIPSKKHKQATKMNSSPVEQGQSEQKVSHSRPTSPTEGNGTTTGSKTSSSNKTLNKSKSHDHNQNFLQVPHEYDSKDHEGNTLGDSAVFSEADKSPVHRHYAQVEYELARDKTSTGPSAMTNGILMLKRKLTGRYNNRKVSFCFVLEVSI